MPKRQSLPRFTPAAASKAQSQPLVARRSANYRPSLWEHEYLLSLGNTYAVRIKYRRVLKNYIIINIQEVFMMI